MRKPELLAPAGDMEKLKMAVLYGADAVYLAGTSFGMRSFAGNFDDDELPRAVAYAHAHGVRVHATVNTMPRFDEAERLPAHLEKLDAAGVDALILADLGAFTLAGKYAPHCERHISTQQSIANHVCAQAWYDLGARRVVLARELSLNEIREIRSRVSPELELETFCHGAMCVSYSGRCLLSNYMTGRDSNRGACAQPCRYQYALMEEKRPGEYFPVFEDEKGTYIMNSRDMCMIDHLDDLMDAGVDCLKIEGRAKSAYYAAIVAGAYRHVLDDVAAGRPADPVLLSAGKLGRVALGKGFQPHGLQHFGAAGLAGGLVFFGFQAAEHVLLHGHVGEQCVVLEQQAHAALLRRQVDVLGAVKQHPAVQYDAARIRLYDTGNAAQGHAFAAAGRAQNGRGGAARGKVGVKGKAIQLFGNVHFKTHARPPAFCFFSSRFTASSTTAEITISTSIRASPGLR